MLHLLVYLLSILNNAEASNGGFLSFKQKYLYDSTVASNAEEGRVKLYSENKWTDSIATRFEVRSEFTSVPLNLSYDIKANERKDLFDLYPGENFIRLKSPGFIAQIGYQEVVWGESFGFNSADFITPKNLNFTFLSESEDSRRPIPVFQVKHLGDNYSLQLLYGAKAEFEKDYPIEIYFRPLFAKEDIQVARDKIDWFKKHEGGAKASVTAMGIDFSVFGYSYVDRKAVYEVQSYVPNSSLLLKENHFRVQSTGTSFSTTIGDFVFRGDFVLHNGKRYNYVNSTGALRHQRLDENIISLGFDTPSYDGYSFFVVASASKLSSELLNGFRKKNQNILSIKVQKEIDSENKIEVIGFSETEDKSHGLQASFTRALSDQIELMLGAESYFGDKEGTSSRLRKFNSGFIKLKSFFNF